MNHPSADPGAITPELHQQLLRMHCEQPVTAAAAAEKCGLSLLQFTAWLQDARTREDLAALRFSADFSMHMFLGQQRLAAIVKLLEISNEGEGETARRASKDLLNFHSIPPLKPEAQTPRNPPPRTEAARIVRDLKALDEFQRTLTPPWERGSTSPRPPTPAPGNAPGSAPGSAPETATHAAAASNMTASMKATAIVLLMLAACWSMPSFQPSALMPQSIAAASSPQIARTDRSIPGRAFAARNRLCDVTAMDASTRRKIRQTLETDKLMGLDSVPMSNRAVVLEHDATPAANAVTGDSMKFAVRRETPPPSAPTTPPRARSAPAAPALPPFAPNTLTAIQKAAALEHLALEHGEQCPHCCPSQRGQLNLVFGEGDPAAQLMFIGEGPGEEEDRAGRPFVGRSGQLLDKQIEAMGLRREQVYIANIVKIRPPSNRVPTPDEAQRCMPWLVRQIEIIAPKVIVTLGATPSKYVLGNPALAITRERGQWKDYRGIPVMPTFHPAYLLRAYTPENRRRVWEDLQKVMERLGLPTPAPK